MMLVRTYHKTFLTYDKAEGLTHSASVNAAIKVGDVSSVAAALGVPDVHVTPCGGGNFRATVGGRFMCATPDGRINIDRTAASVWETFCLVPHPNDVVSDLGRLQLQVTRLNDNDAPVRVHFACGLFPIEGFINIDLGNSAPEFMERFPNQYFILPTVGVPIPLLDETVDFIFHEDFIEHIDQLSQIQFLAETLRIMKTGGVHRVNTPNLLWSMRERSNFKEGFKGVYTGERDLWDHISIYSPSQLEEIARLVGYTDVVFCRRGESISPHAIPDRRPFGDRDDNEGNIFADLVK